MLKCKSSDLFRKELHKTMRRVEAPPVVPSFPSESVFAGVASGIYVYKDYLFQGEKDFEKQYGMRASELGLEVTRMPDETGTLMSGVVVADPDAPRKLRVWHQADVLHQEHVHESKAQLRSGQGRDMYDWFAADIQKSRPKCTPGILLLHSANTSGVERPCPEKVGREAGRERKAGALGSNGCGGCSHGGARGR